MKRIITLFLSICLLLCGCGNNETVEMKQYRATFLSLFDTVTTIVGKAETEEAFHETAQVIHDELEIYHHLFDIYNEYEGVTNLKIVNDHAGVSPVTVDSAIIELLTDCKAYYELTGGMVNVAMGSVLSLWHDARNDGVRDPQRAALPDADKLKLASEHMDFDSVVIDEGASTVYITDPECRLDVGAIAKGWAVQRVAKDAPEGLLISVGGNVCATGPKDSDGTPWVIGVQNPENNAENVHTIYVKKGSVVTSGDYQRAYTVDGKSYHHIIDPQTQMPSAYWRSVTIVCEDSGMADALSTAVFLLPLEEGKALVEKCGAEALWIDASGNIFMTAGFEEMIRT